VKVTTGVRLGRKWYEVERLLLSGESKLKIARMLKISAHSVRAVARQMDAGYYAALSGSGTAAAKGAPSKSGLPDTLRNTAMRAVAAIDAEKLAKASVASCAIVADRLLNRAEALESHGRDLGFLDDLKATFGVQPSHSVSRLTMEQKITVETQHRSQTDT
jgi:hypothetical protein